MVIEYIRYRIDAENAAAFLTAYEEAGTSLKASPNCLGYDLARCTDAPEHFVLRIHWDSVDGHLKGFRTSSQFQSFFKAVKPFLQNIEEMRHYEPTPLSWSR